MFILEYFSTTLSNILAFHECKERSISDGISITIFLEIEFTIKYATRQKSHAAGTGCTRYMSVTHQLSPVLRNKIQPAEGAPRPVLAALAVRIWHWSDLTKIFSSSSEYFSNTTKWGLLEITPQLCWIRCHNLANMTLSSRLKL